MAKYEAVLVLSVAKGEEATQSLADKFKALIEENGTLENVDVWGKRKLAYEINDEAEGHYTVFNFESKPEFPAEFERVAKITDGVLRALVVRA